MKRVISTLMAVAVLMSLVVVLGARADTGDPILLLEQLPDATGALLADSGLWNSGYCTNNPCSVADNVVVLEGEARTISQFQLWGIYSGLTHDPSAYVDDFTVIIHQDPSGMPGTAGRRA